MSIQFSNTTTKRGIIQHLEDECGFNDGDISGDSTKLAKFTADVNNALDEVYALIFKAGGTWQFDDSNHTDYPIMTTDLVDGQRDYTFTVDGSSNIVLDIYKVMVKGSDGIYREIKPVDANTRKTVNFDSSTLDDGQDLEGTPTRYDKLGNGIRLDLIPSYNSTDGLKVYINREGSYFATSDTTKKAGFSGLFHYLLVLIPAYKYARIHLSASARDRLKADMAEMKNELADHFGKRERDINRRITVANHSNK